MSDFHKEQKKINFDQALPLIEEKLKSGGSVKFSPHGISMRPLIRQGKDSVTVSGLGDSPRINDVIFYRRPDGQYVLHRIVGRDAEGFVLRGDNQQILEHGIKEQWIIGVMTAVKRRNREISCDSRGYRVYLKVVLPLWRLWLVPKGYLWRIKNKLKKRNS